MGDRIYWISSHGRNKDGKVRKNRHQFFATKIVVTDQQITLVPEGKVCTYLLETMIQLPALREIGLDWAAGQDVSQDKKRRKRLAPKKEGINIEALCSSSDGSTLYIGFRNPRPNNKAIVVPLHNAAAVIDKQQTPVFSEPLLWDLEGLGLRAMEYSPQHDTYFVVAGFHDGRPGCVLYRWSGRTDDAPRLIGSILPDEPDFMPEAIVSFEGNEGLWFFSDDGSLLIDITSPAECLPGETRNGKCQNKRLTDPNRKTFRGVWLKSQWP